MAAKPRAGVEVRRAADGTPTYRVRWRPGGGRGTQQSHSFSRVAAANALHDELTFGGWICYCPKHAPPGAPISPVPTGIRPAGDHVGTRPSGPTFGEYAARHAAALTGVGEGYRRDVIRDVKRHFQSSRAEDGSTVVGLADRPLGEITRLDVAEWIRGMETGAHWWLHKVACARHETEGASACTKGCDARLSPTTIGRNLAQAGAVMQAAVDAGLGARNPFRKHRLAAVATDEHAGMTFLTWAEWTLLEQALPEGTPRDLCGFLIGSGLRWGEATAVAVGAVDLLATPPRVYVGRAWKKDGKGGVVLGAPKSQRSRRTVPVAPWVRDLLIPHVAGKADEDFLFTGARGGPLKHHSNFYNKVWTPAVAKAQKAGLEKSPRIHDLRHTYASWLLAEGRPLTEVSRRLGHQSIHITDARYSHLLPEADAASAAALERYRTRPVED